MPSLNLNEPLLMAMLDTPVIPQNGDTLCTAANLCLLDGFDHRLLREPFTDIMLCATQLHGIIGRLQVMHVMIALQKGGELTPEKMTVAFDDLTNLGELLRKGLLKKMELVIQCSDEETMKH